MILQLLALMWTSTKNQDVQAKLVLFRLSHIFWFWNPLICFGLGNHLCDPLLWSTSNVQNLSSQEQNLRFIHLVWIPSRLFFRLYQGFPFKIQMNSHKCVLNLKLHWITSSTYNSRSVSTSLQPTIPVRCLLFPSTVPNHQSHQKFSTDILNYPSTILHLSTINRRAGFIKNSSRKKEKKKKKNTLNHEMKICFFQIFKSSFSQPFLTMALSFSTLSNQYCFIISLKSTFSWFSRNPPHSIIVVLRSEQILFLHLRS